MINEDGFLLKVSPDGTSLLYGAYLGGAGADVANAVQVDSLGEAIVAGQTASSDFAGLPATVRGSNDAFLIKFLLKIDFPGSVVCSRETCRTSEAIGTPFSFQLPAMAPAVEPLTVAVSGDVPSELRISANGDMKAERFSQAGQFNFAATYTDATGRREVVNISMWIEQSAGLPIASVAVSPSTATADSPSQ